MMAEAERSDKEKVLEKRIRELEQQLAESKKNSTGRYKGSGIFWGIVFISVGTIWLGNNLGWFYADVPWLAVLAIAGGIYLLTRHYNETHPEQDTE